MRIYAIENGFIEDKISIVNYKESGINKASALILL